MHFARNGIISAVIGAIAAVAIIIPATSALRGSSVPELNLEPSAALNNQVEYGNR